MTTIKVPKPLRERIAGVAAHEGVTAAVCRSSNLFLDIVTAAVSIKRDPLDERSSYLESVV